MVSRELTVQNPLGLQSKSAAVFIQKATAYKSSIWIEKGERKANAKSLLGLLALGIGNGSVISMIADGEDEIQAVTELENYLKSIND